MKFYIVMTVFERLEPTPLYGEAQVTKLSMVEADGIADAYLKAVDFDPAEMTDADPNGLTEEEKASVVEQGLTWVNVGNDAWAWAEEERQLGIGRTQMKAMEAYVMASSTVTMDESWKVPSIDWDQK